MARSSELKFILAGLLVFGIGVILLNLISYNRRQIDGISKKTLETFDERKIVSAVSNEIQADYKSEMKPGMARRRMNATIRKHKIQNKSKGMLVYEAGAGDYHILLLYARKLSWETLGTLDYLSDWGYRAFAVAIPKMEYQAAIEWLTKLIDTLRLRNLVIIGGRMTPSYLFQLNIQGCVLIDPEDADKDSSKSIKVPTLIIHRKKTQTSLKNLQQIPNSEMVFMKNASAMVFHHVLRQFLYRIYRPIYQKSFQISGQKSNTTQFQIKRARKLPA